MDRRTFCRWLILLGLAGSRHGSMAASLPSAPMGGLGLLLLNQAARLQNYFSSHFGLTLNDVYWGDLHNHCRFSQDAQTFCGENVSLKPGEALDYAREEAGLDFVAVTDHAELRTDIAGVHDHWQRWQEVIAKKNDESSFIVFPGWEYTNTLGLAPTGGSTSGYGHKHVVFRDLSGLPAKMIGCFDTLGSNEIVVAKTCSDLWNGLADYLPSSSAEPALAMTMIHTPAMNGQGVKANNHQTDFSYMHGQFVRTIEIYSKWGNSEGPPPEGMDSSADTTLIDYDPDNQEQDKTVRRLLYSKWVQDHDNEFLLAFTGSTDNHMGQPGNTVTNQCGFPYRGGLTGIICNRYRRNDLWEALYRRHTLAATTDWRPGMLFALETAGSHLFMGEVGPHDGTVQVRILADRTVERLELLLDGGLLATVAAPCLDATYQLTPGYHYLYAKAVTTAGLDDARVAWTSPVYLRSQ